MGCFGNIRVFNVYKKSKMGVFFVKNYIPLYSHKSLFKGLFSIL